jgi:hypothetical protein
MYNGQTWQRDQIAVTDQFAYMISQEILDDTPEPTTVKQAQQRPDWPQWEEAINFELDSLIRR